MVDPGKFNKGGTMIKMFPNYQSKLLQHASAKGAMAAPWPPIECFVYGSKGLLERKWEGFT